MFFVLNIKLDENDLDFYSRDCLTLWLKRPVANVLRESEILLASNISSLFEFRIFFDLNLKSSNHYSNIKHQEIMYVHESCTNLEHLDFLILYICLTNLLVLQNLSSKLELT